MDSLLRNAFRLLALPPGAPLAAAYARRDAIRLDRAAGRPALQETEITEAIKRIENPESRLREAVYGGMPESSGHAPLCGRLADLFLRGGSSVEWLESLNAFAALSRHEPFRAGVLAWAALQKNVRLTPPVVKGYIDGIPVELLLINVNLGKAALKQGDRATAKVQAEVIAGAPVPAEVRERALQVMAEAVSAPALERMAAFGKLLESLESAKNPGGGGDLASRLEDVASTSAAAATTAISELDSLAPGASDVVRNAHARLLRRLAMLNARSGGAEPATRRWLEAAMKEARTPLLVKLLEADLRDPKTSAEIEASIALARAGKVEAARKALRNLLRSNRNPEAGLRIREVLDEPRYLMGPIGASPPMFRLNGFGAGIYGSRDTDTDGTYVTTLCVSALFIPVFPIRSYLVKPAGGSGYTFYGRVPLSGFARGWRNLILLTAGVLLAWGIGAAAFENTDYAKEKKALEAASYERFSPGRMIEALRPTFTTSSPERAARRDQLVRGVLKDRLKAARDLAELGRIAMETETSLNSVPPEIRARWFDAELDGLIMERLGAVTCPAPQVPGDASNPQNWNFYETAGLGAQHFLAMVTSSSPGLAPRRFELAAALYARSPHLHVALLPVKWHVEAKDACAAEELDHLEVLLTKVPCPSWRDGFFWFKQAAPAARASAVLAARLKRVWLGYEMAGALIEFRTEMPPLLAKLVEADAEPSIPERVALLGKIPGAMAAIPEGGPPPTDDAGLTAAGIARRQSTMFESLNDQDPDKWSYGLVREWAIRASAWNPDDPALASRAMQHLLATGDAERAVTTGEPHGTDPRVLPWLGVAYARAGRPADAERILDPYVSTNLTPFIDGYAAWNAKSEAAAKSAWERLHSGARVDQNFIRRLNSLPKDQSDAEAARWVRERVAEDGSVSAAERQWRPLEPVRFAARELAVLRLQEARALPAGDQRTALLASAEKLFLSLRKALGDNPGDELALAQVYFWLGRSKEANEIFEKLEKDAPGELLIDMGEAMRTIGRESTARDYLEKAWNLLQGDAKERAARTRVLTSDGIEDELKWLERCDGTDPYIVTMKGRLQARIAMRDGRFADAVAGLRAEVKYYSALGEDPTILNNLGLAQIDLFVAMGDPAALKEGVRLLKRAVEKEPDGGIVVVNATSAELASAYWQLCGGAIDPAPIHERPSSEWLDLAWAGLTAEERHTRAKAQPALRHASELGARATVLAPERIEGYEAQLAFLWLTGDGEGMTRLRDSLESSPPSRPESAFALLGARKDAWTDEDRAEAARTVKRCEMIVAEAKHKGSPATLALALARLADARETMFAVHAEGSTLESALEAIRDARNTLDAPSLRADQARLLLAMEADEFAKVDKDFKGMRDSSPDARGAALLWMYADTTAAGAERVRGRPGVKAAANLIAGGLDAPGLEPQVFAWAVLAMAGHPRAEDLRKRIAASPLDADRIRCLSSLEAQSCFRVGWAIAAAKAEGDTDGEKWLRDWAKAKGMFKMGK
ncbi:MAG: hypothetical protein K8T20_05245 [Planctomycetes bacterium]|nr:hypothetical protein [Planctomycetota bacterium]